MSSAVSQKGYSTLVVKCLKQIEADSKSGEFAYLVATSKPECAIRDRLAFRLQQALGKRRTVARELCNSGKKKVRLDIAILDDNGDGDLAIQLKVRSASTLQDPEKIRKNAVQDLEKCKNHRPRQSLYLLLAPLVESSWDETIPALDLAIVDALREPEAAEVLKGEAGDKVRKAFPAQKWKIQDGIIHVGKAFKANISVLWWLCEKRAMRT